jgi:hypothetical protein
LEKSQYHPCAPIDDLKGWFLVIKTKILFNKLIKEAKQFNKSSKALKASGKSKRKEQNIEIW